MLFCNIVEEHCILYFFQAGEMVRKGKDGALHLRQIRHYMETGSYLPSVHITEKNGIRKSAKKFKMEGKSRILFIMSGKSLDTFLYAPASDALCSSCNMVHV